MIKSKNLFFIICTISYSKGKKIKPRDLKIPVNEILQQKVGYANVFTIKLKYLHFEFTQ